MSTFNLGDPAPINPHDSNELKNLKKAYNESVIQRKLLDKQSTAIDSIKFFSELYVIQGEVVYLKHVLSEIKVALRTISELLLLKTDLPTEKTEKALLDFAKDLGAFKAKIQEEYDLVIKGLNKDKVEQ